MKKSNICRLPTEATSCAIRGRSDGEWHNSDHEQRLEIGGGISHSITSVAKDSYVFEPCILRMERTEEEKRRRHLYGDKGAKFRKGKQYKPMTDGCSRTITTFEHDNLLMEKEKIVNITNKADVEKLKKSVKKRHFRYRIRKLTPRECLRLMGVRDADIDKIQLWPVGKDIKHPSYSKEERIANMTEDEKKRLMKSGISESRQYQLAGNSIVVDCLVNGIFKNLFIESDKPQLTLF